MKRRISLLLAVVMILGSFSFVFAAEESAEAKAGEFLKKVDVLEGINGDLKLGDNLRRQDMVVLIARLHGEEEAAEKFPAEELTFKDFSDPYYKPIIAWAVANNLIVGHTAERFGFNEDVTAQQYATVLLRALGYNDKVATDEGYAKALEEAKKLDILKDLKVEDATVVTRGQMAVMTFNALGTNMKDSDKTLAEKLGIEMPAAAKLEAKVEDTENLKEIVVQLSNAKLANEDKLENTANYRVKGNTIERVEVKDNDVLVQVKDAFRSGKQYELEIKGVDKAIDGKYKFVAKDNTIPSVEKVEVLGEYGVKVITSEPIEDVRGKNFLVDGKYIVMDVETYGRNLVLTPYSGSFPSGAKTLTITGLKDYAGYKSAKEDFDIEIVKDNEAPKVEDVILKGNKVEVVFDKDIYKDSVDAYYSRSSVGNISYELGRHTIYADDAKKIDTNKVAYEFKTDEIPSRRDDVTIVDVQNHSKVKMEKTTIALREVLDDIEPEITDKKIRNVDLVAGTADVYLYFDKDVAGEFIKGSDNEFDVDSHFTLYEDEVSKRNELKNKDHFVSAKYDKDDKEDKDIKDVIVVELKGLEPYKAKTDKDFEYVLEIEGFADVSSSRNKMYRDYYEFKFDKASDFVIKDVNVTYKGTRDTEIEIEFNKKLDRDIVEDATNYIFYTEKDGKKTSRDDVKDLDGEAILKSNGKVVVLEIPEKWDDLREDYAGLKILDVIKDTKGNRIGKTYYYDFDSKELLEEGQTVDGKAVAEVVKLVDALKAVKDIDAKNLEEVEKDVKAIDEAIGELSKEQKALFDKEEAKTKLDAVRAKLAELNAEAGNNEKVQKVVDLINELPEPYLVKVEDEAKIVAAEKALNELGDELKTKVPEELKVKMTAVRAKLDELNADADKKEKVKKVVDLINALPQTYEVEVKDKEQIEAARKAFDELGELKTEVPDGVELKLEAVEAKLTEKITEEKSANQTAVGKAKTAIEGAFDTAVDNAKVDTKEAAIAHVKGILSGLKLDGVQYELNDGTFEAAVAGSSDGSYKFTVKLSKGAEATLAEVTTDEITLKINQ